jgi:hypothetical protein
MGAFIFRCPTTGSKVQAWSADDGGDDVERYETTHCLACGQFHFVNTSTGQLIGEDDDP